MGPTNNFGILPAGNGADPIEAPYTIAGISPGEAPFTWEQGVRVIRKNRRFALAFAAVITLGVTIFAFTMKDIYQPVARLEVDPPSSGIKTLEIEWNTNTQNDTDYLETHAQMLQAEGLAISVIRALHLDRNPEFVGKKALANASQQPAEPSKARNVADHPYLQEPFALATRTPLESAALGVFQKNLAVNTVHASRLIEVSFASHDPQLAQDVVNTLVTNYMDQNYRQRFAATMQASDWLSGQLAGLRQKVEESSRAVTDYQKRYGIIEADDKDIPLSQLMSEVNHQLSAAQATRIEAEAYVRMLDAGQSDAIPALRDDLLYEQLMTRLAEVRGTLAEARTVYGDDNANIKKLQEQANELSAQAAAERARVADQLRTAFNASRVREQLMFQTRDQLRQKLGDASSQMVQYRILRNDALANSQLYDTLKGRLFEAGVYAGLGDTNLRIVDLAPKLRSATGPHRELIIAIGAMVSCVFAMLLAFIKESLNNTVRTPDDIKDWTGLASLAMLPPIEKNGHSRPKALPWSALTFRSSHLAPTATPRIRLISSHTAEAEAMRDLRTALMLSRPGTPPRVILVASSSMAEGKTTVAINLAMVFAQRGKTCLIDGDLRRPMVSTAMGLQVEKGLSHILAGSASLDAVLASIPEVPNLSLLPVGPLPPNPADLVASEPMRALLQEVRERYEHVVIDSPPAIPFSDARVLSSLADAVIFVGRYGVTTRRAIIRCTQLFDEVRAPVVGVVVNGINLTSPDYHYYNYGYSRGMSGDAYMHYYTPPSNGSAKPTDSGADEVKKEVKKKGAHA